MGSAFDADAAQDSKEAAMKRARRAANPDWWAFMLAITREVAQAKPYFFTDDMERLRAMRDGPTTSENRALGPLMKEAQKLGYCLPTDHWVPSSQKVNHSRYMRVWYSLIYQGTKVSRPRKVRVIDPRQFDFL